MVNQLKDPNQESVMESLMYPAPTVVRGLNGLTLNNTKPSDDRKQEDPLEHELMPFAPSLEIMHQFQLFGQSAEPIQGCGIGARWRRIAKCR